MDDQPTKTRRRHLQFSLRTLLILVTLAVGWLIAWRVYTEPYRRQRETMSLIEELGGSYKTEAGGPKWIREWFEAEDFQNITSVDLRGTRVSDADLKHLDGLTNLDELDLHGTKVSDAGLVQIKRLFDLRGLYLGGTQVSDAGLVHLKGLTNLNVLSMWGTEVSDAGLAHLNGLTKLEWLPSRAGELLSRCS